MAMGSVVVRKSVGRQLKGLRLACRKTPTDVQVSGVASTSKLHRIETGEVSVRLETVWALCRLYGADSTTTSKLAELAQNTNHKGWWENFSDAIPPRVGLYVELEAAADTLSNYDPELVPGLLQTPAYHRAIFEFDAYPTAKDVDRQWQMRLARQHAAFDRRPPLRVTAVLGEGVVLREVGGKAVMLEQRQHLLEMTRRPNVEIYIVPWRVGAHAAMKGGFIIAGFDGDDDPDVVHQELYLGGRYMEDANEVRKYQTAFDQVRDVSVTLEEYLK